MLGLIDEDEPVDESSIHDYIMPRVEYKVHDKDGNEVFTTPVDTDQASAMIAYVGTSESPSHYKVLVNYPSIKPSQYPLHGMLYVDGEPLPDVVDKLKTAVKSIVQKSEEVKKNIFNRTGQHINESWLDASDVVTVGDFMKFLKSHSSLDDKVMFRDYSKKEEMTLLDVHAKGGVAVVDFVKGRASMNEGENAYDKWQEAADWFTANGHPIEDDEARLEAFAPQGS